ncbi:unnamed protein product [Caenorhabditis auriculariae]|uniref:Uncharacterized protein n=1 Tax=Caenorhabditis auriculariae TaxID=2777116 RepID=A0A8S1GSM8_9PELO|nr:unnamed protein product [Caenorhabditis auriculariae]
MKASFLHRNTTVCLEISSNQLLIPQTPQQKFPSTLNRRSGFPREGPPSLDRWIATSTFSRLRLGLSVRFNAALGVRRRPASIPACVSTGIHPVTSLDLKPSPLAPLITFPCDLETLQIWSVLGPFLK